MIINELYFRECAKVLPTVFDDALSYYEEICKIAKTTNQLVTQVNTNTTDIAQLKTGKQDKLTAGSNIQISNQNVISATDTTYTAGTGIAISDQHVISATGGASYTAGNNIQISDQNVISATDTTYTAGTNVSISNQNVISAIDTKYTASQGLVMIGNDVQMSGGLFQILNYLNYNAQTETMTINGGLDVKSNGNVTVDGDLQVGDELIIGGANKIVDSTHTPISFGTNVVANETLAGTEANLTELTVGATKYKVQPELVSGTNIKSINGSSILASGNLSLATSTDLQQGLATRQPLGDYATTTQLNAVKAKTDNLAIDGQTGVMTVNSGLDVGTQGDVTVGRDLYVEDEIVIDSLSKIVDVNGNQLKVKIADINSESATAGQVLMADGNGGVTWGTVQGGNPVINVNANSNATIGV